MHWQKLWHPIFEDKYLALLTLVEREIEHSPDHFYETTLYKFFECVTDCIENRIFIDPTLPEFILGNTLGKDNRDWRRAKKACLIAIGCFLNIQQPVIALCWHGLMMKTPYAKRVAKPMCTRYLKRCYCGVKCPAICRR